MGTFALLVVCLCFILAEGYQFYQAKIPNGDLVPHPCKPNFLWKGIGHFNVQGGGERNSFGLDFASFGKTWNKELCEKDSDGDGRTNGEELGDAECTWTPEGNVPSWAASGHPGVCEPVDSTLCKEKNTDLKENWEFCDQGEFECDAINEPGVQNITLLLSPKAEVPAEETTYMCQLKKLPDDHEYQIIAYKPDIDNEVVAHHIVIYGCDEKAAELLGSYSAPTNCRTMSIFRSCTQILGVWTLGQDGYCETPNAGIKFGKGIFNYVVIELHWNNPKKTPNYLDGSGITLFYTSNLRKYDAATLTVGQQGLAIRPNVDTHYDTAICSSECTKNLQEPLYIYRVWLHMHYLGRGGEVEHWRNGTRLRVLADTDNYSYDNPEYLEIDPPIKLKPGDEIRMACKFSSKSRNEVTYFGLGTQDEMCYAVLNYYPKTAFKWCLAYGPVSTCYSSGKDRKAQIYESLKKVGCELTDHVEMMTVFVEEVTAVCGEGENATCTTQCREFLQEAYSTRKCFRYGLIYYLERLMRYNRNKPEVHRLLHVCDEYVVPVNTEIKYHDKETLRADNLDLSPTESSASGVSSKLALITLFVILPQLLQN